MPMVIELEGEKLDIPNFDREEFACKCGCGLNNVKNRFIWKLQLARVEANIPFLINSGCRCRKHNAAEGGKDHSDHLTGEAADIKCLNSMNRWLIIDAAIKAGFKRIGIGKTFVHLGDRWDNPQLRIWLY